MKKVRLREYDLNLKYELKTYKHVGKDYGDKYVNRGWLNNSMRFIRVKISNSKEQRYKFCNTYSEWKSHVRSIIPKNICNYDDFLHFLIWEKKYEETYLETIKIVLIPIYIAMFGMTNLFPTNNAFSTIAIIMLVALFSSGLVFEKGKMVEFYVDFINVVEEEISSKEKEKYSSVADSL